MTDDPLTHREPWDIQPEETPNAYYWFSRYLELPANERSLPRIVSDAIDRGATPRPRNATKGHRDGEAPSLNSLKRWASRHHWEARAGAHDQEAERRKRAALEDEIVEAARRHALQLRLAANVLAWPLQRFWERATSPDPDVREAMAKEFEDLTGPQLIQLASSISRALPVMQEAERLALGLNRQAGDDEPLVDADVHDYASTASRMAAVLAALEEAGYSPEQRP